LQVLALLKEHIMSQAQDRFPRQEERDASGGQTGTQNIGGSRSDVGTPRTGASQTDPTEVVLAYVAALNDEDFKSVRQYMSDDLSFVGVLGSRQGADAYFKDMERMRLKYEIQKVFANGDDVCLLYNLRISGLTVFGCGWYHVENGKIDSLKVLFDPRPILEQSREQ
jgi:predicted ester cyclase